MLYFLHSTSVLSFSTDVVLTLSMRRTKSQNVNVLTRVHAKMSCWGRIRFRGGGGGVFRVHAKMCCWAELDTATLKGNSNVYDHWVVTAAWMHVIFHIAINKYTWSETYVRQDLFPSYLFCRHQFHAIVIFRLKSISDLDSGSLPRFLVNPYTQN